MERVFKMCQGNVVTVSETLVSLAGGTPAPLDRPTALWWMLLMLMMLAAGSARADTNAMDTNAVTVHAEIVTNQFEAYAQVEPIVTLPVRAVEGGQIIKLEIVPGTTVHAGQDLAELGGPEIQALLAQDESAVSVAQTNFLSAQKFLAVDQQQFSSHLVTRQMVIQAEDAVTQAQAALDTAQAQLRVLRKTITLTAPTDGLVLAVNAAEGQRVSIGDTILTLQPADKLWLQATYYGADISAIHAGMTGEFSPANYDKPAPVKVAAVFGVLTPDGGEGIGMVAATSPTNWLNGEFGTVTLNGAQRSLPVIPTRALILDGGQWWVLVRTEKGEEHRAVVPGPARGWQTFIESGLKPGDQVVVGNTYLEFHREISDTYQSDD